MLAISFIDHGLAVDIQHSVLPPEYLEVADIRIYFAYFKDRAFSACLKAQNYFSKQFVIKEKPNHTVVWKWQSPIRNKSLWRVIKFPFVSTWKLFFPPQTSETLTYLNFSVIVRVVLLFFQIKSPFNLSNCSQLSSGTGNFVPLHALHPPETPWKVTLRTGHKQHMC